MVLANSIVNFISYADHTSVLKLFLGNWIMQTYFKTFMRRSTRHLFLLGFLDKMKKKKKSAMGKEIPNARWKTAKKICPCFWYSDQCR